MFIIQHNQGKITISFLAKLLQLFVITLSLNMISAKHQRYHFKHASMLILHNLCRSTWVQVQPCYSALL